MNHPAWALLIIPLISAVIIHLFVKNKANLSAILSTASSILAFGISFFLVIKNAEGAAHFSWASVEGFSGLRIGYQLDQLSRGMMIVVTGIGALVHIFSLAYMKDDRAKARYFCSLSLFMFSMTGIVLADNFIMTFIFWELVGLSSYLLIGHWYEKHSAANAAKKAFITNRIGDFGFMIGILMLWGITGTFNFSEMNGLQASGVVGAAILCIFAGAMGKSAQAPLHVWLPDAMEGPTPVSALIHAATMVAAGVYMLFRLQLSIGTEAFVGFSGTTIAWIGGITSLLAALMATQQDDIKKILAYSTLSQLGYMVMAVGLMTGEAGMFHLFTHAWFKALLFLGSGAIIYACHHEQNIWKMGGLFKKMPITSVTFLIGTAALIAVPLTSGFFSKEQVLEAAHHHNPALFWIAAIVAVLTAFYMTRACIITFLGKARSENADHAKEVNVMMLAPLAILAVLALIAGLPAFANKFAPAYTKVDFHFGIVFLVSIGALIIGVLGAFSLYRGKDEDPINIPLFRERFYIDTIYDKYLVGGVQRIFTALIDFLDQFIIGGLIVGGFSRLAAGFGNIFGRLQSGNLQGYAFLFGLGVLAVIYLTVFVR